MSDHVQPAGRLQRVQPAAARGRSTRRSRRPKTPPSIASWSPVPAKGSARGGLKEFSDGLRVDRRRARGELPPERAPRPGSGEARDRGREWRRRGPGLSFACACDLRVAAESATLVPGFVGIGLVPDAGGTWFVHRLLGFARAFEWMSSNRRLVGGRGAEAGSRLGGDPGRRVRKPRVAELAAEWAARPTLAIARAKRLFEHAYAAALDAQLALEARAAAGVGRHRRLRGRGRARSWRSGHRASPAPERRESPCPRSSGVGRRPCCRTAPARRHRRPAAQPAHRLLPAPARDPLFLWIMLWSLLVVFAVVAAWVVGLVTGRVPNGLHEFMAAYTRFSTHLSGVRLDRSRSVSGVHGRTGPTPSTSGSRRRPRRTASRSFPA